MFDSHPSIGRLVDSLRLRGRDRRARRRARRADRPFTGLETLEPRVLLSASEPMAAAADFTASATGADLVKDIEPGPDDSNPRELTEANGLLFFGTNDGSLWRSLQNGAGTIQLKGGGGVTSLVEMNNTLYFTADAPSDGDFFPDRGLWRSDGSVDGTEFVKTIGSAFAPRTELVNANGTLYFAGENAQSGVELWSSDGTASGTGMLRDIRPGSVDSNPRQFGTRANMLFFSADDGDTGRELYRSLGSEASTIRLSDFAAGGANANPKDITWVRGGSADVFFSADDGSGNRELYRSAGGVGNTELVREIRPGGAGSNPSFLTPFNGEMFFQARDAQGNKLYKSDGTAGGTDAVKFVAIKNKMEVSGGSLFFPGIGSAGTELWKSDGTSSGTQRVVDLKPGPVGTNPIWLTDVNGTLHFTAHGGALSWELYRSDGTAQGTQLVEDINPGGGSIPRFLTTVGRNDALFFSADDGTNGRELWRGTGGNVSSFTLLGDTDSAASDLAASDQAEFAWRDYTTSASSLNTTGWTLDSPHGDSIADSGDDPLPAGEMDSTVEII